MCTKCGTTKYMRICENCGWCMCLCVFVYVVNVPGKMAAVGHTWKSRRVRAAWLWSDNDHISGIVAKAQQDVINELQKSCIDLVTKRAVHNYLKWTILFRVRLGRTRITRQSVGIRDEIQEVACREPSRDLLKAPSDGSWSRMEFHSLGNWFVISILDC